MTVTLFGEFCYGLIFRSLAKFGRYWELCDFLLKELLYLLEIVEVGLAYKGDGATITVGTCRTTYAMHIVLYIMRHIIIDDHLNVVDVDTTSHNISSHKHIYLLALEFEHHLVALCLTKVAMHFACVNLYLLELAVYLLNLLFFAREDDDAVERLIGKDMLEESQLLSLMANIRALLYLFSWFANSQLYLYRILEQRLSQLFNLLWHGGRKHDSLACRRKILGNGKDILREAHVEHTVSLVENKE